MSERRSREGDGYANVRKRTQNQLLPWLVIVCASTGTHAADFPAPGVETTYADHTRAVELSRAGNHIEALSILLPLLDRFPEEYPLQRDVVLITIWKGDCKDGLVRFESLRQRENLEPYLISAVGECLLSQNRPKEAYFLLRRGHERYPDDRGLNNVYLKAEIAVRTGTSMIDERATAGLDLRNNNSDQGLTEWIASIDGSIALSDSARLYVRSTLTRSSQSLYQSGDLNRVGVGVRYQIDERLLFDQEFSGDITQTGQAGSTSRLVYEPRDAWRSSISYASHAESIPLRARAAGITANHSEANVSWEARDFGASWSASASRYNFSDGNYRNGYYVVAGYAWYMQKSAEHRLLIEGYASKNTLAGAAYFNPARDYSIGLTHQTNIIYDSRFRRHVDQLLINASLYEQQGYGAHPRLNLRYEQSYDFDASHALTAGAGLARNIYDGKYETERRFYLTYRRRF